MLGKFLFLVISLTLLSGIALSEGNKIQHDEVQYKIKRLSLDQSLLLLEDLFNNNTATVRNYLNADLDYNITEISRLLFEVARSNAENKSIYMRLLGLITFKNFLLVCMVAVGLVFIVSLFRDILLVMGYFVGYFIYKVFFNKISLYVEGYALSLFSFFVDLKYYPYLDIFEHYGPLFGLLLFSLITMAITCDSVDDKSKKKCIKYVLYTLNYIWILASLYTELSLMGTLTVMLFYHNLGFFLRSYQGIGYQIGFTKEKKIYSCLSVSLLLNTIFVLCRLYDVNLYRAGVFENGIVFWATLVGAVSVLILSSEFYLVTLSKDYTLTSTKYFLSQLIILVYCLSLIYFGNLLYITSYTNIGGTFMLLWVIDVEYAVLSRFKTESLTGISFITLLNLYVIIKVITLYPEYFLFMS